MGDNCIPRISAIVICYKQEELIKRAIDSLIVQKDYLYEICVSDDCSPDKTWEVLLNYQKNYPNLIKLNRNEPNIGIFANIEKSWTMPSGDLVYLMAGDDAAGEGWFQKVVDFIQEREIDYKNESICIYGDYECRYPNGDSKITHNNAVNILPEDAFRMALRGIISNKGICFSSNMISQFDKVSRGHSHIVEHIQDRQVQLCSKKNYYIPALSNIYYSYIGISVHIDEEKFDDRMDIWSYTQEYLNKKGLPLERKDIFWGKANNALLRFQRYHKIKYLITTFWYQLLALEWRFLKIGNNRRDYLFAFLRRIPHKKPLHFK